MPIGLSIKMIGLALGALLISALVFGGYKFISNLQHELVVTAAALETEKLARDLSDNALRVAREQHDEMLERIKAIEDERQQVQIETNQLETTILDDDRLKETLKNDPAKTAADFTARLHALNRLLERQSRGQATGHSDH